MVNKAPTQGFILLQGPRHEMLLLWSLSNAKSYCRKVKLLFLEKCTTRCVLMRLLSIRLSPTKHRPTPIKYFLKKILLHRYFAGNFSCFTQEKCFYEKLYLIFRISSQRLYQSFTFIISFYKKYEKFKKCILEKQKNGYLAIFFKDYCFICVVSLFTIFATFTQF